MMTTQRRRGGGEEEEEEEEEEDEEEEGRVGGECGGADIVECGRSLDQGKGHCTA